MVEIRLARKGTNETRLETGNCVRWTGFVIQTHPLCQLRVHHKVVHVFLGSRQLQLSGENCHDESCTASSLQSDKCQVIFISEL